MATTPPLCPSCGQPASEALGGPAHDWKCRNEACAEFGQPVRADEPTLPEHGGATDPRTAAPVTSGSPLDPEQAVVADDRQH